MRKWFIITITIVSICFIAINTYLIWKDDSKVKHTVYVDKWTQVKERNIIKTFETKGLLIPQEESNVYFDDRDKEFLRFLVKKGDEVTTGTPLLEYATPELDQLKDTLEAEIQQLEGEISSTETYISSLSDYQVTVSSTSTSSSDIAYDSIFPLEEGLIIKEDTSNETIISMIEQEMLKQEFEISELEEKKKKYETQLNLVNENNGTAMVISEIDGIVKEVNDKLGNPVVTIVSNVLAIEGSFTEKQYKVAENGMPFTATIDGEKTKIEGTLSEINTYPEEEPEMNRENQYPFQAALTEQVDTLPIGTKMTVSVVTDKAENAPTVPQKVIKYNSKKSKAAIYTLNENGLVSKQAVKTGLGFNGVRAVEGVEIGKIVMATPPHNEGRYVTKMKPSYLSKSGFKGLTTRENWEAFLIGLGES